MSSSPPLQYELSIEFEDGKFTPVALRDEDIGAELLPLLSRGLYTDPLHCIREYVQNSTDAGAKDVTIKLTGNSVIIYDDGVGMDLQRLVQARQFGVSTKDPTVAVGFRGIGIYSGYDLCNRLNITTKRAGEKYAYVLEFDFGAMKTHLASDRELGKKTSLGKLLSDYSRFARESAPVGDRYTVVQLEDISKEHINQLGERRKLRSYILRNLPIDFGDDFPHREVIMRTIREHIPNYHAIRVKLESDDSPAEVVTRPTIPDLDSPYVGVIKDQKNEDIAFYWACLRKQLKPEEPRGQIPPEFAEYRGFTYKMKGFTIGTNEKLRRVFKTGNSGLYWWFTGEVYVIDRKVTPNAERNDFETSSAQRILESAVEDELKGLESKAAKYQSQERAVARFLSAQNDIKKIRAETGADPVPAHGVLSNLLDELKTQKKKLEESRRAWGQEIIEEGEKLRKQIHREITRPQENKEPRKRTESNKSESSEPGAAPSEPSSDEPAPPDPRSMSELFGQSGIEVSAESQLLLEVIDEAVRDVLGIGSTLHLDILKTIDAKLSQDQE